MSQQLYHCIDCKQQISITNVDHCVHCGSIDPTHQKRDELKIRRENERKALIILAAMIVFVIILAVASFA